MILKKIVVENFRQFRNNQEIIFHTSVPSITIIYGKNGRGKTGLFRALIFCLFGDKLLAQDENTDKKDINLVNTQALDDANGRPVVAMVSTTLSHENKTYEVSRKIKGSKIGNEVLEEYVEFTLTETDEHGNTKPPIRDQVIINETIGNIFDPKIKDYFLFDGEKIERLTRADSQQKKNVAQGIKNLLNINDLENAMNGMKRLLGNLTSQLRAHAQGEFARVLYSIESTNNSMTLNRENKDILLAEQDKAENAKVACDRELEQINGIRGIILERRALIAQESELELVQSDRIDFLRQKLTGAAVALLLPVIEKVYAQLDEKKQTGEIPVQSKLELIEKILKDHKCICGTVVNPGSCEYSLIEKWKSRVVDSGLSDYALNLWRDLNAIIKETPITVDSIHKTLVDYDNKQIEITKIHEKLKKLSDKIDDSAEEKAIATNHSRDELIKDIERFKGQIKTLDIEYQRFDSQKNDLTRQKEILKAKEDIRNELENCASLATDTNEVLNQIYKSFTEDMKKQLSVLASSAMELLLGKEGKWSLKRIVVKEDYSLQVHDHRDEPSLANISAGQRQIISLCFITALAQAATGMERFEIPLFMDTPFGRLDLEHRKNLISFIPKICQQWVTMVTDTELTETEWGFFRESGLDFAFYKLSPLPDGTTIIENIPLDEALTSIRTH